MRIGLYIEHGVGNGVGGAELKLAYLASAWSAEHQVDLIHHRPPFTRERVAMFCPDDLSRVTFRYVPREGEPAAHANPLKRFRAAAEWHRAVSDGYDVFVNCTHWVPCFCHARVGLMLVLFPFYIRPDRDDHLASLPAWKRLRHKAYYGWEWSHRIATYQHRVANSAFSQEWARRRWGVECDVVYPPVLVAAPGDKRSLILSVGRFSTMAHTKKQLELMHAFCELQHTGLRDWSYASVGGLNSRPENHAYFESVQAAGRDCSTVVAANLDPHALRTLFQSAKIFWHATGLNDDTDARPELAEHFGISTVEAMGAGCVPVVINKGGQPEIVEHGVSGFVWNTVDELKRYTSLLADDASLWAKMSAAAQSRAQAFSRERFLAGLSSRLGIHVSVDDGSRLLPSVPSAARPLDSVA
jgi:glycosyltransferase involved in cell wall biosynthesis